MKTTASRIVVNCEIDVTTYPMPTAEYLTRRRDKLVAYTVKHPELHELYVRSRSVFWTDEEIDYTVDIEHWNTKLSDGQRRLLSAVLKFFSVADELVNRNIKTNFGDEITLPEADVFYNFQSMMEDIHKITYADGLRALIKNPEEIENVMDEISEFPCIKRKMEWAMEYMDRKHPLYVRLGAFAIMEAVYFSSAFAVIYYFKHQGLMPGLTFANQLIQRDEAMHAEFACLLMKLIDEDRPSQDVMHEMMRRAVSIEEDSLRDAIPVHLAGINAGLMGQYVRYCTDRLLKFMGYDPIWNVSQPFDWMNQFDVFTKTNFFERRHADYVKVTHAMPSDEKQVLDLMQNLDAVEF